MDTTKQLLLDIEAYLVRNRMRATEFGVESVGDTAFVHRLRLGRSPSLRTADKVRAFMRPKQAKARAAAE
jgi:hypothetical protein